MQAAFVSIGLDRDAFLYVEDAAPRRRRSSSARRRRSRGGRPGDRADRPRIDDLVKEGQEIVVQVTKDPVGVEGPARLDGDLARRPDARLPARRRGRSACRGASPTRRSASACARSSRRCPGAGGFIARTAALGKSAEELSAGPPLPDGPRGAHRAAPGERVARPRCCTASSTWRCASVRDLAADDCDDDPRRRRGDARADEGAPRRGRARASRAGSSSTPGPSRSSSASASRRRSRTRCRAASRLPSGGSIVIHQTEALVAIDVNTGRFVGKDGLEETVFALNLEAAPEVARQIRLRDLGGLLVVDFIDMEDPEHRQALFERFEEEMARDRARTRAAADLRVRPDRDHPPALARQPRAGPDARLPGLLGERPGEDRPDRRARPAAAASGGRRRPFAGRDGSRAGAPGRRTPARRGRPEDPRGDRGASSESGSS